MPGLFESDTFEQSRPILLTTFTNKVGSIGLSLVSILLVERGVTTPEGTFVLATLKLTLLAGTLAGGALSDRVSSRGLVLAALLLSAFGLGLLPFAKLIGLLILFGVASQFGDSIVNVAQRILLIEHVQPERQKEALGWMRMAANLAQIVSYSVATLASRLGVMPLMLFDAATSLLAFGVGRKILPPDTARERDKGLSAGKGRDGGSLAGFAACAFVLFGWALFYELFIEGGSGRLEVLHPGEGLRRFSEAMILNTILCTAFAVRATSMFSNTLKAISLGLALTGAGLLLAAWGMAAQGWVFAGMLLITLGEIMLGAVAQYSLMRLVPPGRNSGLLYSTGVTLMQCGRIAGAALAFPLLIHARSLVPITAVVAAALPLCLAVLYSQRRSIARLS